MQFQSKPSEIKDNEPLVLELKRGKSGEKELWLDSQKLRNVKRFTVKCYGDRATADLKVKILVRLAEKLPIRERAGEQFDLTEEMCYSDFFRDIDQDRK